MTPSGSRRIACVQIDSKHADVKANAAKVRRLVDEFVVQRETKPIDLLVLPELALTGYVFSDHREIQPLLESRSSANTPSLDLAAELAQKLSCYVVIGYPALCDPSSEGQDSDHGENTTATSSAKSLISVSHDARPNQAHGQGPPPLHHSAFNSAALVDPKGQLIHTFRKHFLFDDDKRWASEGPGFETLHLPHLGRICVAICMDLNPYEFRAPFEAYELASHCVDQNVDVLIMPMAWLLPKDEVPEGEHPDSLVTSEPSLSTINYWAMRCQPFFGDPQAPERARLTAKDSKMRYFISANRTGKEGDSIFAGSSCVMQMRSSQRPLLLGSLGVHQEGVLIVDLPASDG